MFSNIVVIVCLQKLLLCNFFISRYQKYKTVFNKRCLLAVSSVQFVSLIGLELRKELHLKQHMGRVEFPFGQVKLEYWTSGKNEVDCPEFFIIIVLGQTFCQSITLISLGIVSFAAVISVSLPAPYPPRHRKPDTTTAAKETSLDTNHAF